MSFSKLLSRARGSSGFARLGALGVLGALAAAVLVGHGYARRLVHLGGGGAWLTARRSGEVVHVNGASGDVDARASLTKMLRGTFAVAAQNSKVAWVTDATGHAYAVDLATLTPTAAASNPGKGTQLYLGDSQAYVANLATGQIQLVDASSLSPIGAPVELHHPVVGAADSTGALWVLVPATGDLLQVSGGKVAARHHLAAANSATQVSVLGATPVVLAAAPHGAQLLQPGAAPITLPGSPEVAALTLQAPLAASRPVTSAVVLDRAGATLYSVPLHGGGHPLQAHLPGKDGQYGAPVVQGTFAYVPDVATGSVVQVDLHSGHVHRQKLGAPGQQLEVFDQGDYVYLNAPDASTAYVAGTDGQLTKITKNSTDVPGAPKPSTPPTPATIPPPVTQPVSGPQGPTTPVTPTTAAPPSTRAPPARTPPASTPGAPPTVPATKPGAPPTVTATAGDQKAVVSWGAPNEGNGVVQTVTVRAYKVKSASGTPSGEPATSVDVPISASAPSAAGTTTVDGLHNGTWYVFTATATNEVGAGPAGMSAAVKPQSGIPDLVTKVHATYQGSGTIAVSWTAPSAHGVSVTGYHVTGAPSSGKAVTTTVGPGVVDATFSSSSGIKRAASYTFTVKVLYTDTSGAATTGPAGAASNTVLAEAAPAKRPSLSASASGTTVRVKVSDSGGWDGPDDCKLLVDGSAHGTIANCQGSRSFSYACGKTTKTHTYQAVPSNAAGTGPDSHRESVSIKACPPPPTTQPPKPSVNASEGRYQTDPPTCVSEYCHYVEVTLRNIKVTNNTLITCSDSDGEFYHYHPKSATSVGCIYGHPGRKVTVTVNGQYRATVTWTSRKK